MKKRLLSESFENKILHVLFVCLLNLSPLLVASAAAKGGLVLQASQLQIPSDGKTLCTSQLQQAIDRIAKKGKGTLVLTSGTYLSGSIFLKSGVTLKLEKGATLLGSPNPYDYKLVDVGVSGDDTRHDNACMALVMAQDAKHIAIENEGVIEAMVCNLP